ncbi:MAG: F0F1 ATP synthase subunit delta [Syntrophomonadaceae bacterium]|nr:F0F1 ATP synthase subunit delta [Syntrophomonadaceae bacterium]
MLNKSVARRYAEAFFGIAQGAQKIEDYQQELEYVVQVIDEVENLKEYFGHLLIPAKEKKEVVRKIFAERISQTTLNFLLLIIDKRRESYIGLIAEEYKLLADEARNITKAELVSAQEISDEEIKSLSEALSATTGKTVQLKPTVDPSLLGGVKIRIGDQIIDGTVTKKLEILKEKLKQAKIS